MTGLFYTSVAFQIQYWWLQACQRGPSLIVISSHLTRYLKSVLLKKPNKFCLILIMNISMISFSNCSHINRIQLVVLEAHKFYNRNYLLVLSRTMWTILPQRIAFHKLSLSCRYIYSLQKTERHFPLVWNFPSKAQKALPDTFIKFHNLCNTE